jgi:hypothetical protein
MKTNNKTLKNVINAKLRDPDTTRDQRQVLCDVMDEVISGYQNGIHTFCFLDLTDNLLWLSKGKPSVTLDNCHWFGIDPTRREYF